MMIIGLEKEHFLDWNMNFDAFAKWQICQIQVPHIKISSVNGKL